MSGNAYSPGGITRRSSGRGARGSLPRAAVVAYTATNPRHPAPRR